VANEENSDRSITRGRKFLVRGAITQTVGLAIVGTTSTWIGSWVVLAGWILLIYGLHTFGRAPAAT
jgi:hypothetical protein